MMQGCHRGDQIEAMSREGMGHNIALDQCDARLQATDPGARENITVPVDCDDFLATRRELSSKQPLAAAHIEHTLAPPRSGTQHHVVILNAMIPRLIGACFVHYEPGTSPERLDRSDPLVCAPTPAGTGGPRQVAPSSASAN